MAGAILTDVNVTGADLATDLQQADLTGMDLTACHLAEVDLREAELSGANLEDMDLTGAGLADRSHSRPVERGMSRGHTPRTAALAMHNTAMYNAAMYTQVRVL